MIREVFGATRQTFVIARAVCFLLLLGLAGGCATSHSSMPTAPHRFDFARDTFSFPNEIVREYHFDENGKWIRKRPNPTSHYTHRCFIVVRTARQFFANARFDPTLPVADDKTYRELIHRVTRSTERHPSPDDKKIVIPGYANLREFSEAHKELLRANCGGAWRTYVQFCYWRIVFPYSRSGQSAVARKLAESADRKWPVMAHAILFPSLAINHTVLIYGAKETEKEIQFTTYDPNNMNEPITIRFDRERRTFFFPRTRYFPGAPVDLYEIYAP